MPYKSDKQRRFLHAKKPRLAARWDKKYGGRIIGKKRSRKILARFARSGKK